MNPTTPHISIKNIYFWYKKSKKDLIQNISLDIPAGSILQLDWPSGSGKTTFLELVWGILLPKSWEICIWKTPTKKLNKQRFSLFWYAFVDPDFFENMSVEDNILMPSRSMNKDIDMNWYSTLIEDLWLTPYTESKLWNISAWQRERVNLARALIHKPKILILDEPWSHLDDILVWKVIQIILEYSQKQKSTIFISSHRDMTDIHFDFLLSFYENDNLSIQANTKSQD